MSLLLMRIGFGLIVLSLLFLVFVFVRAYRDPEKRTDRRYRVVVGALAVCCMAIALGFTGRLSMAFGGPAIHPMTLTVASVLVLISSAAIIGSTAIGGNRSTLNFFLLSSAAWIAGCVAGAML